MKLITYMDQGKPRTLMVDEFHDAYLTAEGWTRKYAVGYAMGEYKVEILADDIVAEHTLREPLHDVRFTDKL